MTLLNTLLHGKTLGKSFCACAPSPPAAPDYAGAAKQQGKDNIAASRVENKMNNPNVVNPYGTQTVTWQPQLDRSGYDAAMSKWFAQQAKTNGMNMPPMPTKEQFMSGDQPTITQRFSPEQQAIFDESNRTKLALSQLANKGAATAGNVIGKEVDFSGMPAAPGSATDTRARVMDAMMARVNEDTDRRQGVINSNLLASGIPRGSKAYQDAMALDERNRTDARNQAYLASGQEMSRDFATDTERRRNAIAEMMTARQTPLNEVTALMSGSQVNNPFAMPGASQGANVAAAPTFAGMNAAAGYNTDLYNAQAAGAAGQQSGLIGLGGTAIMAGAMM